MSRRVGGRTTFGVLWAAARCAAWIASAASCGGETAGDPNRAGQCGEEVGVPVGEFHRAGQDCQGCHAFSVAGTVFSKSSPDRDVGVAGVEVEISDATGAKFRAVSNCVGNFFVKPDEFTPRFPVVVRLRKGNVYGPLTHEPISASASCSSCHRRTTGDSAQSSVGRAGGVVAIATDEDPRARECPVDPTLDVDVCR